MKPPIHEVVRRIQRLPLKHKVAHIRALVAVEEKESRRTQRYGELTSLLASIQTRRLQLNK